MRTKNNVFVKIANKKEGKNAKRILEALGEDRWGNTYFDGNAGLYFNDTFKKWCYAQSFEGGLKTYIEVTLKELIQIIVGEQEEVKELEVGNWYKRKDLDGCLVFKVDGDGGYGFWNGDWSSKWMCTDPKIWLLATNEEVLEALSKEAVKRGFKEGVTVNNHQGTNKLPHFDLNNINMLFGDGIYYNDDKFGIWLCYKGKWAEIIEEPKSILITN